MRSYSTEDARANKFGPLSALAWDGEQIFVRHNSIRYVLIIVLCVSVVFCSWKRAEDPPATPVIEADRFPSPLRSRIREAQERLASRPRDAEANGYLAMLLHAHGQYAAAEASYRRAHAFDPRAFRWLYYLALAESAQGKNTEALAALRKALRMESEYGPARLKLAELALETGDRPRSIETYTELAKTRPYAARAWYGLGKAYSAEGEWQRAIAALAQACEAHPGYGAAHYALATAYRRVGQTKTADQHVAAYERHRSDEPPVEDPLLAAISSFSMSASNYVKTGAELESQGKLSEALEAHRKALELDPSLQQAHINLISLYGRMGDAAAAEKHYRSVLLLNPQSAGAHYNFGVLAVENKRYAEAKSAFEKALQANPQHADAHTNLGYLLEQEGKLYDAARHYRAAIENKPELRLAHFHLGRVLLNRRLYPEAIEEFNRTLTPEDDTTPGYVYALAIAFGRSGDAARAAEHMRKARRMAAARNQSDLVASIDRDLLRLKQASQR